MYLNFFNLKKEPFQITPDPSFLYLSAGHKEALASIIYGVEKKKGFILIVGAVGVGKTTILRAYLEKNENDKLIKIYVFNPNLSYAALLRLIFRELNLRPSSDDPTEMVSQLHRALIELYRDGRNVLLLIDEAQNMPVDTLENLRMLSNLETSTEKLIQIVFSAQPEFEKTVNLEELRQLKQRIAVKAVIKPLTEAEGLAYIDHRLKTASDRVSPIFTRFALREIVRVSKGIPRIINVICDNSLITAFGYGKRKVGYRVIREIVRDFGMEPPWYRRWRWALVCLVLLLFLGLWNYVGVRQSPATAPAAPMHAKEAPPPPSPAPAKETADTESAAPPPPQQQDAVSRVIERGDTLAGLIKKVYGHVDSSMIRMVKQANPHIEDEDLIVEGGQIVFPGKKETQPHRRPQ